MFCPRCQTPMREDGIKEFPAHTRRLQTCPECGLGFPTEETPANPGRLRDNLRNWLAQAVKVRKGRRSKRHPRKRA